MAVYDQGTGAGYRDETGDSTIEDGAFTIAVYTTSATGGKVASNSLARAVAREMKDPVLYFSEGRLMYCRRKQIYAARLDPDPGPHGVDVYQTVVTVDYKIERDA